MKRTSRPLRWLVALCTLAACVTILAFAASPALAQRTAITGVRLSSTPATGDTYGRGESIEAEVTWAQAVTWDVSATNAKIRLRLEIGAQGNTRQMGLVTGGATSGTASTLTFRYTVVASDSDTNGVAVIAASGGDLVFVANGATILGADNRHVNRKHTGLAANASHKVDGSIEAETNNDPVFANSTASREVAENTAADNNVGAAIPAATDTDNDSLTYKMEGDDAASFNFNISTRQITTKSGVTYDHETKSSYSVTIKADDNKGGEATVAVTITVTDVTEAPAAPAAPTVSAGSSNTELSVSWSAPTNTGPDIDDYDVRYFQGSADPTQESQWTTHAHTGATTSTTITGLDHGSAYRVQVLASNDEGDSSWSSSGSGTTSNTSPVFANSTASREVAENTAADNNVGAAIPAATDTDNDSLTYNMEGTDAASFNFNISTRQITTKSGVTYDHETKSSYSVTIKADDSKGGEATVAVTITVTDVTEAPAAPAAPTVSAASTVSLNVSWSAPTNTGPDIDDYDVRYFQGSADPTQESQWTTHAHTGATTSTTITGLVASTNYRVQVLASNAESDSSWSVSGSGTTNAPPAVSSVALVSTPTVDVDGNNTNETYKVGDVVQARVTFNAAVDATGSPVLKLRLATGVERNMTATATTNSTTLDFRYTVAAGDRSTQGIGFGANTLSAGTGAAIREASTTTDANLGFAAVAHNAGHKVDGVAPSLSSATVNGATLKLTYGETLDRNSVPAKSVFTVTVDGSTANLATNNPVDVDGSAVTLTLASAVVHSDAVRVSYDTPTSDPIQDVASNDAPDLTNHSVTNNTPNRAPAFTSQPSTLSVEENSTGGASVGTVAATDPDGDTVTHSLDSASDAVFDISSSTGEITVQSGADLNFEGTSSYTATVTATDSESATATHEVTINVTDADEPPDAPGAPTVSAAAGQTAPVSLTVQWTAPVVTGRPAIDDYDVQFRKSTASSWSDHAHTGTGTSTTIGSLASRLEPGTRYDVQVRAVNDEGEGFWSTIGNGTTAPPDTTPPSFSSATVDRTVLKVVFNENLHAGSKPPTGAFKVQVAGNPVTLDAGLTIADATVTLTLSETVASGATVTLAYTNTNQFSPALRDPFDNEVKTFGAQTVTNNTPSRSDTTAPAVSSATVKGTALSVTFNEDLDTASLPAGSVFALNAFYPDGDDEDEVRTQGTGTVSISGRTVSVTLARAVPAGGRVVLGYSKPSTSALRDAAGNVVTNFIQSVTNNTPGAPAFDDGATVTLSVAENAASVGTVTATDPDRDTLTYSLSGTHAEFFDIDIRTGQITVGSDITLDFESTPSYSVTVQVSDGEDTDGDPETSPGIDDTITVTIEVTDVNEPPPPPDAPAVNVVSTSSMEVSWTAPDTTGRPDIDGYDVQFKKSAAERWADHPHDSTDIATTISELDANSTYEVRVRATNDEGEGGWSEAGSGATGNTAPVFTGQPATASVAENSTGGTPVVTVEATDTDNGDTLDYSLDSTSAAVFDIDSSGNITVRSGAALDHETTPSYTATVTATDSQSATATHQVTISVTDVREPPPAPDAPTVSTASESSLEVSWTAPDTTDRPDISDYDVQYRESGATDWTDHPHDGSDTTTTIGELTADTTYDVQVLAHNAEGASSWSVAGSGATNAPDNTAPVFTGQPASASVAENSPAGTAVVTVETTDADANDTLTYSLDSTSGAVFDIDSSGNITVRSGAALDHETTPSYTATVTATDSQSATATHQVTISVTDVPEPPPAPDAPTVSTASESSLEVSWTAPDTTGRPDISDYDVRYFAGASDPASESDWIEPGEAAGHNHTGTGTSATITGLSPNTAYRVQVRAANDEGAGVWSTAGSGVTNAPGNTAPVFTGQPATASVGENSTTGTAVVTVEATDADANDTLGYSLDSTSGAVFDIDSSGNITVRSGAALDHETTPSYTTTVTATDSQSVSTVHEVTISVTDVPEPPPAPDAPTVSTASESSLNVNWTAPDVTGRPDISDYDVRYFAGASDPASESNWIEPGEAAGHDHTGTGTSATITGLSPNTAYRVQVRAANDEGAGVWSTAGSGVTNAPGNTAPVFTGQPATASVAENSTAGTAVVTVEATDTDNGDTLTYSLDSTSGAVFGIDSRGNITVRSGANLNHEGTSSYTATVTATDSQSVSATHEVTISVTDLPEPPPAPGAPTVSTASESSLNVNWTAPDTTGRPDISDYNVRYKKSAATEWSDHVYSGTGTSTTITGLDANTQYDVQMLARNAEGVSSWSPSASAITSTLNNEPVFATTSVTLRVAEHTAVNGNVGAAVTATDADGDTLTYSLGGTDVASFEINTRTGQITVGSGTALNFETKTSYAVTVTADDGHGGSATATVTINVTDVNEAPRFPSATATRSIAENHADAANVGAPVAATDPDGDTLSYTLGSSGTDHQSFTIDGAGQIKVKSGTTLDRESKAKYSVTVTASDGSLNDTITVTINVRNVNEAPSFPSTTATRSIAENHADAANVGAPVAAADDDGDTLTYTLASYGTDHQSFTIDNAGQIKVKSGTTLDRESRARYLVRVTASDGTFNPAVIVTINVRNVNEAPSFPSATATRSIAENHADAANMGAPVAATDPDGDTLSYTLGSSGTDHQSFTIDSAGQIKVKSGTTLDRESKAKYSVTVTASDGSLSDTITVTINVTDVNDPPRFPNPTATRSIAENHADAANVGAPVAAADDDGDTLTYTLASYGTDHQSFTIDNAGQIKVKSGTTLDRESRARYLVRVTASDGTFNPAVIVTINVRNVNEVPSFPSATATRSIAENHADAANVGAPVAATDPDGDTLSYTLASSGTDHQSFTIDNAGQIKVKSGTTLDRESRARYLVRVTASDGTFNPSVIVTINVTDVNKAPSFGDAAVAALALEAGRAMEPVVLPEASGGNGGLDYRLTSAPAGLAGLSFDPATRRLSGTPSAEGSYVFSYRVEDGDDDRADTDAAVLSFTVTVEDARTASLRVAVKRTLAAVVRRALSSALDNIGARFANSISDTSIPLADWNAAEELLHTRALSLTLGAAGVSGPPAPRWSVWGRGDLGSYEGRADPGTRYSGETRGGWLGVDARAGQWVAGLAFSHERGEAEYDTGLSGRGRLETKMNAVYPYGRWTFANGLEVRGVLGAGTGEARHMPEDGKWATGDLTMWMASLDLRRDLPAVGGIDLAVRTDASLAVMETGEGPRNIDGLSADTWRGRLGLEASRRLALGGDKAITPFVEAAARRDGGDGLTGTGLEVAGGVRYNAPEFQVEARGRWLAAHAQKEARERGASVTVRVGPGADGRGLSLSLAPRWGAATSGAEALWRDEMPRLSAGNPGGNAGALDAHIGYGIALPSRGMLTPFAEAGLTGGHSRRIRLGMRFNASRLNLGVELSGERQESRVADPEHAFRLGLRLRF